MGMESYDEALKRESVEMSDGLFQYILKEWYAGNEIILPRKIDYPFGTKEWAQKTYNSHEGCLNSCLNCFGRNLAWQKKFRFWELYDKGMITRKGDWIKTWKRQKDGFWFMYPSMHDTFEDTVEDAIKKKIY